MAERQEHQPGTHAPVTGRYEELNIFGTWTGRIEHVRNSASNGISNRVGISPFGDVPTPAQSLLPHGLTATGAYNARKEALLKDRRSRD
jgi:hypothetical protein